MLLNGNFLSSDALSDGELLEKVKVEVICYYFLIIWKI